MFVTLSLSISVIQTSVGSSVFQTNPIFYCHSPSFIHYRAPAKFCVYGICAGIFGDIQSYFAVIIMETFGFTDTPVRVITEQRRVVPQ